MSRSGLSASETSDDSRSTIYGIADSIRKLISATNNAHRVNLVNIVRAPTRLSARYLSYMQLLGQMSRDQIT